MGLKYDAADSLEVVELKHYYSSDIKCVPSDRRDQLGVRCVDNRPVVELMQLQYEEKYTFDVHELIAIETRPTPQEDHRIAFFLTQPSDLFLTAKEDGSLVYETGAALVKSTDYRYPVTDGRIFLPSMYDDYYYTFESYKFPGKYVSFQKMHQPLLLKASSPSDEATHFFMNLQLDDRMKRMLQPTRLRHGAV